MARARNIKPSLLLNELLGTADPLLTILFTGLWMLADRDGKLEDRPLKIKAQVFPYRELPDFNGYLTELERLGFILRYEVSGEHFILVKNFNKHQSPHKTERASEIPDPLPESQTKSDSCPVTVKAPLSNESITVKESLIPDSLIPDSLIPESEAQAPTRKKFMPPTVQEVADYVATREIKIDPQRFVDSNTAKGWVIGKTPMKDWRAAVRTWESNEHGNAQKFTSQPNNTRRLSGAERTRLARDEARESVTRSPDLGCVGAD